MSKTNITNFLKEVSKTPQEMEKLKTMRKTELVSLANQKGYTFTLAELIEVVDDHRNDKTIVDEIVPYCSCTNMTSCWVDCPTP